MSVTTQQSTPSLLERSREYLGYLDAWLASRPSEALSDLIGQAGGPQRVAVMSVDLIVGFCHSGPLSSPRIVGILPSVRDLMERASALGVRHFVLTQDTHLPDAEEFASYPPHCVRGTAEAETVPELASLPFASSFSIIEKNSISSVIEPTFAGWEEKNGPFAAYVIVGDCTDLCVYQAAMALKTRSNTHHLGQSVVVPVDCVETYDMPVDVARNVGAEPHDGDLLHAIFLHSMALNGIRVVSRLT